jgi:hypothetical protein
MTAAVRTAHRRAVALVGVLVMTIAASCASASSWAWRKVPDPGPLGPREGVALAVTPAGAIAWGGLDVDGTLHDDGALLEDNRWTDLPPGPLSARHSSGVAVLDGGRVVIVGGSSASNLNGEGDLRDGAVYDIDARRWEPIEPLPDRVALSRSCRTLIVIGDRLVTPCVGDGEPWAELVAGQWIQLVPPPGVDRASLQLATSGRELIAVWVSGGTLRSARDSGRGWVLTSGGDVGEVATPLGRVAPLAVTTAGGRVAALTTERVWWFDGDRRWTPGLRIPPEPNAAISNTAIAVGVADVLIRLDLGRDLVLEEAEWRLIPRPDGVPEPWLRQAPACGPTSCLVVGEPPGAEPLSGRHTVWWLSRA